MPDDPYAVDVIFGRYEDGDGGGCDNFGRCVTFGTVAAGTGGAGTGDGVTTAGGADIFFSFQFAFLKIIIDFIYCILPSLSISLKLSMIAF